MGDVILRVARDRPRYVVWSAVVDGPMFAGTAEQVVEYVAERAAVEAARRTREALARADERGTSDRHFGIGGWDDAALSAGWRGSLPRHLLERYAELLQAGQDDEADQLLTDREPDSEGDDEEGALSR